MRNRSRIRLLTVFLFLVTGILVILYQLSLPGGSGVLPVGARRKLPTGPVTPVLSMTPTHGLIVAGDGSLWSWGERPESVLGLGAITNTPYLRRIGKDTNWVSVSAEQLYSLAVKSDGTMWAWGLNTYGQFGNGTRTVTTWPRSPNRIDTTPIPAAPGNDWKAVAAGGSFSIGLKTNGTVWAWGFNIGVQNSGTPYSLNPVQIGSDTNWIRIAAAGYNAAGMKSDGSLWILGGDKYHRGSILSPVPTFAGTNWADANFGSGMLLAVRSDGTLWGLGEPDYWSYGNIRDQESGVVRIGTNNDWKSIHGGDEAFSFLLMRKDGTIWKLDQRQAPKSAGAAPNGPQFTRVELPDAPVALGVALSRTYIALGRNGEVWTWGEMLGTNAPPQPSLQSLAKWAKKIGLNVHWGDAHPIVREKPWLLPNIDPDAPSGK